MGKESYKQEFIPVSSSQGFTSRRRLDFAMTPGSVKEKNVFLLYSSTHCTSLYNNRSLMYATSQLVHLCRAKPQHVKEFSFVRLHLNLSPVQFWKSEIKAVEKGYQLIFQANQWNPQNKLCQADNEQVHLLLLTFGFLIFVSLKSFFLALFVIFCFLQTIAMKQFLVIIWLINLPNFYTKIWF